MPIALRKQLRNGTGWFLFFAIAIGLIVWGTGFVGELQQEFKESQYRVQEAQDTARESF